MKEQFKKKVEKFEKLIEEAHKELPGLEEWEYLIHHIHKDKETGKEVLHHCQLVDHLGNMYLIDHVKNSKGTFTHSIKGLMESQDIFWSDEEAVQAGQEIPCANRQLK